MRIHLPSQWKKPLVAALGFVLLGWSDDLGDDPDLTPPHVEAEHVEAREPARVPIRGTDFPDGVLALTWDDGPDKGTVELARYLHAEKVAGTFFVVREWVDDVSEEPGVGSSLHATGYAHLPVLGELVSLGHRVGNHTANHVLLDRVSAATVVQQLDESQRALEPFVRGDLRMFRAPGGAWSRSAAAALADPAYAMFVGPFHWDIDGKDWESSLYCRASAAECEPGPIPGRTRVRPDVVARRYVARAESARHGIVLLHDRVGDVGSHYALDVARRLVPELKARGFVFAAPVLEFGPLHRWSGTLPTQARAQANTETKLADIDGDGHVDLCELAPQGAEGGIDCALSDGKRFGPRRRWSVAGDFDFVREGGGRSVIQLADINGDGRADVCVSGKDGIECALSSGRDFKRGSLWSPTFTTDFRLVDIDGNGRADLCIPRSEQIESFECGLAP